MQVILKEIVKRDDLFGFDSVRLYEEHTKDGVFGYTGADFSESRHFCPKLEHMLIIDYKGNISRCNHIWNCEEYNIKNKSIQDAWESKVINDIRVNYPDNLCQPCDQWSGRTTGRVWQKRDNKIIETKR